MSKRSVYCGPPQSLDAGSRCSETSPQPSPRSVPASSHKGKIHCPLKPAAMPGPLHVRALSVCMAGFPSKVSCKTPSLANLVGKSLCNAPFEAQIPVAYRESKCLPLQSQWTSILLAPWRMPCYLPRWKAARPVWQSEVPGTQACGGCRLKCFCWAQFGWHLFWLTHIKCADGDAHQAVTVAVGRFPKGAWGEGTHIHPQWIYQGYIFWLV